MLRCISGKRIKNVCNTARQQNVDCATIHAKYSQHMKIGFRLQFTSIIIPGIGT